MTSHPINARAFCCQPGGQEAGVRQAFARAVPLRTLVIPCRAARAMGIPAAAALGDACRGAIVRTIAAAILGALHDIDRKAQALVIANCGPASASAAASAAASASARA